MNDFLTILSYVAPVLSAVIGWLIGKKKADNDLINEQRDTLAKTLEFNSKLVEDSIRLNETVMTLKKENAEFVAVKNRQDRLLKDMNKLKKENEELKVKLRELQEKLDELLTISDTADNDETAV